MHKSLRKIGLIVLLIFVLPILVFFIYQFASLSESEKELNKIYTQQLETIIYSVNQYSEDIISSWANEINKNYRSIEESTDTFQRINSAVKKVFISNLGSRNIKYLSKDDSETSQQMSELILQKLDENDYVARRLVSFLEKGYKKIEPLGGILNDSLFICLFPMEPYKDNKIVGIVFDPDEFIYRNLASKISQTAGNEFILVVVNNDSNESIFSTASLSQEANIFEKPLWLLPKYSLGILMKSGNIQDLVLQRFYTNLLVLLLLLIVLISGLVLIYYNIKKELRLNQLKSDFIANVSHELRTPLALISMYSETLALDRLKSEEKKLEYSSVIHSETRRLNKIVNTILNFSKMETQSRKFNYESCSLIDVNAEVLDTYDYHIKNSGFNYSVNSDEKLNKIYFDKDAVSESIINLIDNAIKYCNDQKEFIITVGENEEGQFWKIKDFGIGITSAEQKKIFEKFYRVTSGLVNNKKGTGLGLSLVKQIMNAHKGEIFVESELGKGSTFILQFNKEFSLETNGKDNG